MEGEGWWARRETAETFSGLSDECFAGEAAGEEREGRGGGDDRSDVPEASR